MLDKNYLVSVVIPTYKRSVNLKRAINSVLSQTYQNIEILVIDDNDAETADRLRTELFMEQYSGRPDIRYLRHPRNLNGAAARNTGIKNSKGRFVAFLDDDDEWEESKISKQINHLLNNPDYKACYCLSKKYKNGLLYYYSKYNKAGSLSADLLILRTEIYTPSLIFYKEALLAIGCFDESFARHQDFELLLKYFRKFEITCVSDYLVKIHADDAVNHLSFEQFELMKFKFLEKFSDDIFRLSVSNQKMIFKEHYFELAYYALKNKKIMKCFFYAIKAKPGPVFLWIKKNKLQYLLKKIR